MGPAVGCCFLLCGGFVGFFTFFDIGNAWGEDQSVTWDSLRASVGLGISWVSPLGPLKLSYGTPVMYQQTDRIQPFQFQIGTRF